MGNSSSVYAAVKPLEGSVDDFTNAQKASDMKYREMGIERENKLEKQKKYNKALTDKNNDDVDRRYGTAIKSEGAFTTNVQELNMNTISTLSKRLQEVTDKIKDPSLSEEERNKYRVEADAIHNSPSSIKTAGENLSTAYASHLKDVEDGNAYLNTKLRDAATLGYGATAIWDSEKNQVVYAVKQKGEDGAMVDQDTNKDGKIDSLDYVTINDLIADTGKFKSEERYKQEDVAKIILPKISLEEKVWNNGDRKGKDVVATKSQALDLTESYYLLDSGELSPMGKSMARERGIDVSTPEKIEKFVKESSIEFFNQKKQIHRDEQISSNLAQQRYNDSLNTTTTIETPIVYDGAKTGETTIKKSTTTKGNKAEKPKANSGFDANAFYKKHKKK